MIDEPGGHNEQSEAAKAYADRKALNAKLARDPKVAEILAEGEVLGDVVWAWHKLSDKTKDQILALIRADGG